MTNPIRIVVSIVLLMLSNAGPRAANGQSTSPAIAPTDSASRQESQPADSRSSVSLSIESDTRFGILTYVPEQWGELHLRLENSAATPRDLLSTTYVGSQSSLQFGRQVWLPGKSRLNISHLMLFPKADEFKNEVADIHSLLIDRSAGNELILKNEAGQLLQERSLLVTPTARNSGIVAGWSSNDSIPQDVLDLIVAGRVNQGLNNSVAALTGHFLPSDETSLRFLDHIVIAENRLLDDLSGLVALRRWLHAGGRLWIMLDRTDPELVERLLGDDFDGHVVDRVGLTSVRIDKAGTLLAPNGEQGKQIEYEDPVDMVRVVVSGMEVSHIVDGWPAAMMGKCGEGRLLITTVGARGWITPAQSIVPAASTNRLNDKTSAFQPIAPMEDLAAFVFSNRDPEPLPPAELESLTQEFVSYRVPSWALVTGVMFAFLLFLTSAGLWLWHSKQMEHFGWVGSVLAGLFAGLFVIVGVSYRYGVPETVATVQFAEAISGSDDVRTHGTTAVFRREGSSSPVSATQGGMLLPDLAGSEGSTRRMVTTDLGKFHWEGLPQTAGLHTYPQSSSQSFPDRIVANATLDSNGIVGSLQGRSAVNADAVITTQNGRMSVTFGDNGKFTATADQVLQPDQFLDVQFVGEVQDRRRRIIQQLLTGPTWKKSLSSPQLLVWINDWDNGFQFGEGLQARGETLMAVPLEFSRPPVGTEIVVPSPLISYAGCQAPDGSLPAGFWDDLRGEWQERSGTSTTWLSFQLPRSILPLKATRAQIIAKVSGAMGEIKIIGVKDGTGVPLQTVRDPAGLLQFDIDDPTVLNVTMDGQLSLGITAGMTDVLDPQATVDIMTASPKNYWRIESLTLQLSGVTTELLAEESE